MLARGVRSDAWAAKGLRRWLRVAVGVSGGVDSSVAALLLQRHGHDVVGVHMTNWDASDEVGEAECPQTQDRRDARNVCRTLGIPLHEVSFVREYWNSVFEPFLEAYEAGFTPNPDVHCNREIKFDCFVREAERLGCDAIATGHYAQLDTAPSAPSLLREGADSGKDQSYFLSLVRREAFSRTLFPLGGMHKEEVRALAAEAGLGTATKGESMGICFIGKRDFGAFLSEYLTMEEGDVETLEGGAVVGRHAGLARYAIGQGARLSGQHVRHFVVGKDRARNTLLVTPGGDHPALFRRHVYVPESHFNWIAGPPDALDSEGGLTTTCRIRHLARRLDCSVRRVPWDHLRSAGAVPVPQREDRASDDALLEITFHQPVRAPGVLQVAALYGDEGHCLGGGPISLLGPSMWEEGRAAPP